ncbi:hypothetical protein VHUM_02407 [Vanrija humicola]|uniref:Sacsin/Nov domain-containing protein n=1 Tax=Vanrija humicola TaxID=5417 RepID=A0A7D8UZI8_VANHU|nr:hypothetical protein VHUM_02407 [Vanrija humicola]
MPPPSRAELWSAGRDETVEVNQRALIDKILARYSGEHTIFRELLQNADDAGAQHVQVKFYTRAGIDAQEAGRPPATLPDVKQDAIHRYVVCNDGIPFRGEDWHRLKKIAEGNPDEEKIGAFGVGFYSLWSVCDDPFVESGNKWMGFYWKDGKDQLLARSGDLPPGSSASATADPTSTGNPWTTFTMALREPTPLEGPLDFARFLVTSLTFMRTIKRIDMVVDDIKVLEVRKDVKGRTAVSRPGLNTTSTNGMMRVAAVDATTMVITARVMKWLSATGVTPPPIPPPSAKTAARGLLASFFGRSTPVHDPTPLPSPAPPDDPTEVDVLAREIQTYQADIKVSISSQFGRELERATKKAPPSRMPASLVFSREDESVTVDGTPTEKKAGVVFSGLCPPLDGEKSARVFIGQPTGQTTGIGGHLAARFIPTVERESIDLVDRHVAQWNRELLWIGGYLARLIYELELFDLQQQWNKTTTTDQAARAQILARALHALKFFSFRPTTPSAAVGSEMESAFFSSARNNSNLPLLSTAGILPIAQIRIPHEELQSFLPDLPVLTPATLTDAPRAVARLRERGLLRDIAFDDAVKQLGQRPLTEKEMVHCLAWWQSIATVDGYTPQVRDRLLDAAVVITDDSKVVPLGVIRSYVNPQSSSIPTDMPLPPDTLPYSVTKGLKGAQIQAIFGWSELSLAHYVTYLANPPMSGSNGADPATDIRLSPAFSERVLTMLGRGWQSVSANQHTAITEALKEVPCIPTRAGFKKPREAYFENNLLFDDLPVIAFPKTTAIKGGLEKMLLAIGVRRTVDLQLVFSRLIGGGTWGCFELMKYLVSVKDTLSQEELARLRQTAAFPLEQAPLEDGTKLPLVRQKPHQLYEPTEAMRNLGLPVLDWGEAKWRSNSDEAKMMFELGLRKIPPVDVLLGIIAGRPPTNERALAYLLANINTNYPSFDPSAYRDVAFIPATSADGKQIFGKPGQVFTNHACSILGFSVARPPVSAPENAAKLRLATDPPMEQLVTALINNPLHDLAKAKAVFEYLASRVGTAQVAALLPLSVQPFIPVQEEKNIRLARPDEVYFASKSGVEPLYASAFTFIDFGERANLFLRQCNVKAEPSHKGEDMCVRNDADRQILRDCYFVILSAC